MFSRYLNNYLKTVLLEFKTHDHTHLNDIFQLIRMEIKGSRPKEVEYIEKLLYEYDDSRTWKEKIKNPTRSCEGRMKTEIANNITDDTDTHLLQFLDKLIEEGALKQVGYKKNASNKRPTYKVDKAALRESFSDTVFYIKNKKLFIDTLDKEEGAFVWN